MVQYLREGSTWTFPFPLLVPVNSMYRADFNRSMSLAHNIAQIRAFLHSRLVLIHFKMNYGKQNTQGQPVDPEMFTPDRLNLVAGITPYDEWIGTQSKTNRYRRRWFEHYIKRPLEAMRLFTVEATEYRYTQIYIYHQQNIV